MRPLEVGPVRRVCGPGVEVGEHATVAKVVQQIAQALRALGMAGRWTMFQTVEVPVLGILENMSYFTPPDLPDRKYHIFGQGGGKRTADELGVPFLGEIPIDSRIVEGGDSGVPIVVQAPDSVAAKVFREVAGTIARKLAVLADRTPAIADANITWVS